MAGKSTILEIAEFSQKLSSIEKPGKRAKARIYCQRCRRHHHLHWGEFKRALKGKETCGVVLPTPSSLQGIIDVYAVKYCGCSIFS
ncbi:MAG TPA: hypothetical protein VFF49_02225 [Thermodesulfobacteriota bacterium]|nr:hypothetical protein [Thermodesulfobacteriota bacterium]